MTKKDLTGQRFGRLVVTELSYHDNAGRAHWTCVCDCGNETKVVKNSLTKRLTESCGCLQKESRIMQAKNMTRSENFKNYIKKDVQEGTRITTISERKNRKDNTSGVRGVYWIKKSKKWKAQITFKGTHHHLGVFANKQDAIKARKEAEEKYFKPMLEKYDYKKEDK